MSDIIAKNSKGETRSFNRVQWDLLGKNKEGWVPVSSQSVTAEPLTPPSTAEKQAPVAPVEEKVTNETTTSEAVVEDNSNPAVETEVVSDEAKKKEDFINATQGITKSTIKDYFDKAGIAYDNKANLESLINQLGDHLQWNIEELAKNF